LVAKLNGNPEWTVPTAVAAPQRTAGLCDYNL
jgi:hypothetical protein